MPDAKGWVRYRQPRPAPTQELRVELTRRGELLAGVSAWEQFSRNLRPDSCVGLAEYAEQLDKLSRITATAVIDLAATCGDERGTFERYLAAQCAKRVLDSGLAVRFPVPELIRALGVYACLTLGSPLTTCSCVTGPPRSQLAAIRTALPELH